MKIGVLTFHAILNDGSVIQAYCLQKKIAEQFPNAEVEIVDYIPLQTVKRNLIKIYRPDVPFFQFNEIVSALRQRLFLKRFSVLSPKSKITDNIDSASKFLLSQNYDVIIVGSDTVWDTRLKGGAPVPPNLYFLPFDFNGKKIAYAASMDKGDIVSLGHAKWRECVKLIKNFDFVGVRDKNTMEHIQNVDAGISISFTPDPTFIYDFSNLCEQNNIFTSIVNGKKIAGISVSRPELRVDLARQLERSGYFPVNLLGDVEGVYKISQKLSIQEKLGVFKRLDILFTDRFHSSIFAMKLSGCPVIMIEPDYYYPAMNSKGRDLFNRIGLEEFVYRYIAENSIPSDFVNKWIEIIKNVEPDTSEKIKLIGKDVDPIFIKIKKIVGK